jgi:hypothetical protein
LSSAIARSDADTAGNPAINGRRSIVLCCDRNADCDTHTRRYTRTHRDTYTDGKHLTRSTAHGEPNS